MDAEHADKDPLFTVCICTHNRAGLLAAALESVCRQTLSPAQYEVLVIDNASTDATPQVVAEVAARFPQVRYCIEPHLGTSWARNRAASEARGEWLAYLDDDAQAASDWLAVAAQVIEEHEPDLLGGPFTAAYTTPKPAWYRDAYGSLDLGPVGRCLPPEEYLAGGNFFIRRELVTGSNGVLFPVEYGPVGARMAYGEETVLQRRLRQKHPALCVYYAPNLRIQHRVAPAKMRLSAELRRHWRIGRWDYLIVAGGRHTLAARHLVGFAALPVWILAQALIGVWLRDRRRFPYWQNYIYEVVLGQVRLWGKLCQRLASVLSGEGRR